MQKHRINRNAQSSPLLRLPPEIRCAIFTEVLGDRLIHLKKLDDSWHVIVCDPGAAEPVRHHEQESEEDGTDTSIRSNRWAKYAGWGPWCTSRKNGHT